ncbi:DUF5681 domain-containing protein [Sphaerotilus sp.]|uniref:DUF5681 domain-containing protein n=1 Tax=Sphaerotilus sp. TaxID=2093942 RepID=UPI00286DEC5C|nr:DUF5681 domain-containing protein [Sphaerotilus sp.]
MTEATNNPPDGEAPDSKPTSGRWKPGQSGNPGGRKRRSEADRKIEELARNASEDAFETVHALMSTADQERTKLAAALAILERAHGKPGERLAEPIELAPDATLADQGRAVMQAACRGDLTPTQAGALLGCLSSLARLVELTDLEARIAALEKQGDGA